MRKRHVVQAQSGWQVGKGISAETGSSRGVPLMAQSLVLTSAAHRERSGPGGAAEGASQQTAGTNQPRACAQVSGQVGKEGPHAANSAHFLGTHHLGMLPLLLPQHHFTTFCILLVLACPSDHCLLCPL